MSVGRLDLAVLELVVAVEMHGSVGAASRVVGMAQPNASRALRRFERSMGFAVLDRGPTGSTLTAEGTVIAHWARRVLVEAGRLLDVADGIRVEQAPHLTVAASMTVAEQLLPQWLAAFRGCDPDVKIHLQVHNSVQVFDLLTAGRCDVGFVEAPTVPRGLHSVTVAHDELVVVVSADHEWARRRRPLTARELAAAALVVREPGSGTRTTLDLTLRDYVRAAPLLELGSAAAIRASVLAGVGPAVMSSLAVADQLRTGELRRVEVEELDLTRWLRAVWRPPRRLEGPAADLIRLIRNACS